MKNYGLSKRRMLLVGTLMAMAVSMVLPLGVVKATWLFDSGGPGGYPQPSLRPMLILVHGIYSSNDTWNDFLDAVPSNTKYGPRIYAVDLYRDTCTILWKSDCVPIGPGIIAGTMTVDGVEMGISKEFKTSDDTLAKRLYDFITSKIDDSYQYAIDIVAHSMGGLVTRAMIKYFTNNGEIYRYGNPNDPYPHYINTVHFLGTPNHGVDIPTSVKITDYQLLMIDSTATYPWIANNLFPLNYMGSIKWYTYRGMDPRGTDLLSGLLGAVVGMNSDGVVPYSSVRLSGDGLGGDFSFFVTHNELNKKSTIISMVLDILLNSPVITSKTIYYRMTYLHIYNDKDPIGSGEIRVIINGKNVFSRNMDSGESWIGRPDWRTITAYYYRGSYHYTIHIWEDDFYFSKNDLVLGMTTSISSDSTGYFYTSTSNSNAYITLQFLV